MFKIVVLALLVIAMPAFCQEDFKREIDSIYNFHPHKMERHEQEKIFPVLDSFFAKIKSDTAKYLPMLRQELKSETHLPYFYFDCAHLLMMLSEARADRETCAKAFVKTNVKDLDPRMYIIILNELARDNIDVTRAALKILEDPEFSFFVPEHAMRFMQGYCLTYCLLPLDPKLFVNPLIQAFGTSKNVNAQKSIITTLWFTYSCPGENFLKGLNESDGLSKEVAKYSKTLLANDQLDKEYRKMLSSISLEELNQLERNALSRFSDEAIYDLDFVTKARRAKFSCR